MKIGYSLDIPDDLTLVEAARLAVLAANNTERARFDMRPFIVWLRDNYSEYVRPISENAWLLKEYFPHCARNYRNGGIGIKQRAAKNFIGFLEDQGWSKGVVCPTIMTASRNPRCVPTSKVKAAIAEAEPCLSRMLTFMVETGCRPSEARRLSWGHVHFPDDLPLKANGIGLAKFIDHRYYTEHQKVDGKIRRFPLPKSICVMLEVMKLKAQNTALTSKVFRSPRGWPWGERNLRKALGRLKAGVTAYDFRHAHAQLSMDAGESDDIIARRMGHSNTETLKCYAEVRDQRVLDEAQERKELL